MSFAKEKKDQPADLFLEWLFSPEQNGPDPPGDGRTRLPAGGEDGRRGRREEGEMSRQLNRR